MDDDLPDDQFQPYDPQLPSFDPEEEMPTASGLFRAAMQLGAAVNVTPPFQEYIEGTATKFHGAVSQSAQAPYPALRKQGE